MFKKIINNNNEKGFTMPELLIGMYIIVVALAGSIGLLLEVTQGIHDVKNRVLAAHLAQEAIEMGHAKRNNNYINNLAFNDGFDSGSQCVIYDGTHFGKGSDCSAGNKLFKSPTPPFYVHNTAFEKTPFTRTVSINPNRMDADLDTDYIALSVQVRWGTGPARRITIDSRLYDWK